MVRHVLSNVLDTEIVNHKGESDVFGGMLPKGRGPSDGGVAKLCKMHIEPIVCDAAGLFQAWHAFADLQVYRWRRLYWAMISSGSIARLIFIYS